MPDWLKFAAGVTGIALAFWMLWRLMGRSQEGDPNKRGRDSSEPGGYYTDDPG